jgi:hypothetical protein
MGSLTPPKGEGKQEDVVRALDLDPAVVHVKTPVDIEHVVSRQPIFSRHKKPAFQSGDLLLEPGNKVT